MNEKLVNRNEFHPYAGSVVRFEEEETPFGTSYIELRAVWDLKDHVCIDIGTLESGEQGSFLLKKSDAEEFAKAILVFSGAKEKF